MARPTLYHLHNPNQVVIYVKMRFIKPKYSYAIGRQMYQMHY